MLAMGERVNGNWSSDALAIWKKISNQNYFQRRQLESAITYQIVL